MSTQVLPAVTAARSTALQGTHLLVVVLDPSLALAVAAACAGAGAEVAVARTPTAALEALRSRSRGFDGAILDLELSPMALGEVSAALRAHERPCHYGLLGDPVRHGGERGIFATGAVTLTSLPVHAPELVQTMVRIVDATSAMRASCQGNRTPTAPRVLPLTRRDAPRTRVRVDYAVDGMAGELGLSPRERAILRYIALGYRYQEIGLELSISPRTVKMHATNVRRKVGVGTRWELMRKMFAA